MYHRLAISHFTIKPLEGVVAVVPCEIAREAHENFSP